MYPPQSSTALSSSSFQIGRHANQSEAQEPPREPSFAAEDPAAAVHAMPAEQPEAEPAANGTARVPER
jgi:hypothetical protein